MNKNIKILLIGLSVAGCVYVIARVTGALVSYTIPTSSNEPAIKVNSRIYASNLKKAERGELVVYQSEAAAFASDRSIANPLSLRFVHRLCAVENDIIQMKNGVLFVNGHNTDEALNLYHVYNVPDISVVQGIYDSSGEANNVYVYPDAKDTKVNLTTEMLKKLKHPDGATLYLAGFDSSENGAFMWLNKNPGKWTTDDFGPLTIPPGSGFVMGDNRHNSLDSRYWGFIRLSDIKGVKL